MSFDLNPEEIRAALWAVHAARAVLRRATEEGRLSASYNFSGQNAQSVIELQLSLAAGDLLPEDREMIIGALNFALSLFDPDMDDIRSVLEPPSADTLRTARSKIIDDRDFGDQHSNA
ncbi:hypothetical protein ACFOPQ_15745 [Deinococcus antarcticus]|uniref:Uncharacterized protein n=1 Tax=Deinococcus antarcticus TaxID=1298767 RepID=A0ABV8ADB2_9DEIO